MTFLMEYKDDINCPHQCPFLDVIAFIAHYCQFQPISFIVYDIKKYNRINIFKKYLSINS